MKKIIIRVESHSKSWIWGMETRIKEFTNILKNDYTFLSNSDFLIKNNFFWVKNIFSNYFGFWGILKDIFSFRDFEIIESNWLRDNIISSLNFFLFLPSYKLKKVKLFLVIHGNQWIEQNSWIKKFIYDFILKLGFLISSKIIVVSDELKDYIAKRYWFQKKIEVIPNFVKFRWENIFKENKIIQKCVIISRLDSQKAVWIEKAIDFCVKNNLFLDIYWNGEYLASLRKKFKKENKIKFLWFKKQEEIDYKKYGLIFAMWRALLEWISNWLVWILLGYDDLICPISEQNYKKIKYSNFSWRWVEKQDINLENIWKNREKVFELVKNDFSLENLKDYYK